jgi:muramoyltetrapeptide carboxypeptidase
MNSRRKFIRNSVLGTGLLTFGANSIVHAEIVKENPAAILPPKLNKGDLVALMAPAGAIFNEEAITKSRSALEAMGFRVKVGATAATKTGYLAGDDEFRAKEFMSFMNDKEVKAIIALRGGWGCARMLPFVDMSIIIDNPKVICGFSDITTLLLAIYRQTGLVTFHGPVGNSTWEGATTTNFLDVVQARKLPLSLSNPEVKVVSEGYGAGKLIGGNLSIICSLIGTSFLPDFKDAILFLEETEEEPYRVDRMLTQLSMCGILDKLSGVVFGTCAKCEAEEPEKSFTLDEVLDHHFKSRSYPVIKGFAIGHIKDKFTLPVGVNAELDTKEKALLISSAAVRI